MGGINPFIKPVEAKLPTKAYTITFMPMNEKVVVDPKELPYSRDGQPGSILEIALGHDIPIDHACGGVCACSTCHVIVRSGSESIPEATEDEEDQLDNAPGLTPLSRLACQAVPDGSTDIVVEIPDWNRNMVKETH
jgi:2Fe-2S ferredoxin